MMLWFVIGHAVEGKSLIASAGRSRGIPMTSYRPGDGTADCGLAKAYRRIAQSSTKAVAL
jgi:hypothetical protein